MRDNNISILSTRILDSSQTEKLVLAGFSVEQHAFIEVEQETHPALLTAMARLAALPATVIFTSTNAVEALKALPEIKQATWTIYCLGAGTKKMVAEVFPRGKIAGIADNALALGQEILEQSPAGELHFFCGDQRRDDLPALLRRHQINLSEWVVYHTRLRPKAMDGEWEAILFFSPSAVRSYFSANEDRPGKTFFTIGRTTANEIRKHSANKIISSKDASVDALLNELIGYFHKNSSAIG